MRLQNLSLILAVLVTSACSHGGPDSAPSSSKPVVPNPPAIGIPKACTESAVQFYNEVSQIGFLKVHPSDLEVAASGYSCAMLNVSMIEPCLAVEAPENKQKYVKLKEVTLKKTDYSSICDVAIEKSLALGKKQKGEADQTLLADKSVRFDVLQDETYGNPTWVSNGEFLTSEEAATKKLSTGVGSDPNCYISGKGTGLKTLLKTAAWEFTAAEVNGNLVLTSGEDLTIECSNFSKVIYSWTAGDLRKILGGTFEVTVK